MDKLEKERYWLSLQLRSAQKEATKYRNAYEGQIRRIARFETLVDMERERNGQLRQVLYKADQRIVRVSRLEMINMFSEKWSALSRRVPIASCG